MDINKELTNCCNYDASCRVVEFYSKNKFEKLLHLVGFIIRTYHDAQSYECQKPVVCLHYF